MTHIFAFDIIPRTILQRGIPLWIDEGLAELLRGGSGRQLDLMMIRDAAITEQMPRSSRSREFQPLSAAASSTTWATPASSSSKSRYGKEGIRQFLYTLRKGILGGTVDDIFQQAFRIDPRRFRPGLRQVAAGALQALPRQGAAGRLRHATSPRTRRRRSYTQVFGFAPSPSGEVIAALTANRNGGRRPTSCSCPHKDGTVHASNLTSGLTGNEPSRASP